MTDPLPPYQPDLTLITHIERPRRHPVSTPAPSTPTPPIIGKPGVQTTEFYVTVATVLCAVASVILHRDLNHDVPLVAEAAAALTTAGYSVSRAITKVGVVRALSNASVRTTINAAVRQVADVAEVLAPKDAGAISSVAGDVTAVTQLGVPSQPPVPAIPPPPAPLSSDQQATLDALLAQQARSAAGVPLPAVAPVVASV